MTLPIQKIHCHNYNNSTEEKKSEVTIEDPIAWVLNCGESNGDGRTGRKKSFYCQQEHFAKSVGNDKNTTNDGGDTICTGDSMNVVNKKADLSFYKLTDQTCSEKKENCIFVTGKYSHCEKWSEIPYKNIYYCNMCAVFERHKIKDEYVTTMCGYCKLSCQQKEEISTSSKGDHSVGNKRPRRTTR